MHSKAVRIAGCDLRFIDVPMRMPLKFGAQTLTEVTCARARVRVRRGDGLEADGWGETPLSVGWLWPSDIAHETRRAALCDFARLIERELPVFDAEGHPVEIGHDFIESELPKLRDEFGDGRPPAESLPHLAALAVFSAFDLALHDAFGCVHFVPSYHTYTREWMSRDLADFLEPADDAPDVSFAGRFPAGFLVPRRDRLPVWHLVGGLDPLDDEDLTGDEPDDGYPVLLRDWIRRDGLQCLKIKLRGNDPDWDFERLVRVADVGFANGARHLTADFNCTVTDPAVVHETLDRLERDRPDIFRAILYIEQPFPYDLAAHPIDVGSLSARKPLFLDESAHDWTFVRRGRDLGWNGVALKTCKTQTGALLSLCWAQAHGIQLMVQDLTNPMLAQITHVLLAAHTDTLMGVESNGMQFYPDASLPEAHVHPGVFRRRAGALDLSTIRGPGFGYRLGEIQRNLD